MDPLAGFFNERPDPGPTGGGGNKRGGDFNEGPPKYRKLGATTSVPAGKGGFGGGFGGNSGAASSSHGKGGKGKGKGKDSGGGGQTISYDRMPNVRDASELQGHLQGQIKNLQGCLEDLSFMNLQVMASQGLSLQGPFSEAYDLLCDIQNESETELPPWEDKQLTFGCNELGIACPEHLDAQFAQNLYRRGFYCGHYVYVSMFPDYHPSMNKQQSDGLPVVLMVAEKPSIARVVAESLSGGRGLRTRKTCSRACQAQEFIAWFEPAQQKCKIIMTSVIGHVFGLSFKQQKGLHPENMYWAEVTKHIEESTQKNRVVEHLQQLAEESTYMALWLDCDREGENICFEVMSVCREFFPTDENIYRAHFSAITKSEIEKSYANLIRPNKHLSLSVDARQELDLKVGVSFTRLLTRRFLDAAKQKFPRIDLKVLSYGPCQTPTLFFCVQRHKEIQNFKTDGWYQPKFNLQGMLFKGERVYEDWGNNWSRAAVIQSSTQENKYIKRPVGLNTVQMLKAASTLGISPGTAMKVAEELYSKGYMSYPRTESTKYPPSYNVTEILREQARHPTWGKTVNIILQSHNGHVRPPSGGVDKGDHPPITPMRIAGRDEFQKGNQWKLYDYVCRHFIGSLMEDVKYVENVAVAQLDGYPFTATWHEITERGFLFAMPWMDKKLNQANVRASLQQGQQIQANVQVDSGNTKPPDWLKEGELIGLMDQHGIGTDASMAQHIENVCTRNYVTVCGPSMEPKKPGARIMEKGKGKGKQKGGERPTSRHLVPTGLGLAILDMFARLSPDLCEPPVRAYMEKQVAMICEGTASKEDVLNENLQMFHDKFKKFQENLDSVAHILEPKNNDYQDQRHSNQDGGKGFGGGRPFGGGKGGGKGGGAGIHGKVKFGAPQNAGKGPNRVLRY